jgi:MFS family permease
MKFFNHQRGRHIGIYILMLTGGNYLFAVFSGLINDSMGWEWVMVSLIRHDRSMVLKFLIP